MLYLFINWLDIYDREKYIHKWYLSTSSLMELEYFPPVFRLAYTVDLDSVNNQLEVLMEIKDLFLETDFCCL